MKLKRIKKISVKTEFGWISAFENRGKIFQIKFGKVKKQSQNQVLKNFKKNLTGFFNKKTLNIKAPYKIEGSQIQKKVWSWFKLILYNYKKKKKIHSKNS